MPLHLTLAVAIQDSLVHISNSGTGTVASAFTHLLLCAAVFPCAVDSHRAHLIDLVMYGADEQTSRLITKQLHRLQQMAAVKQCVATVRVSSADLRDDIEDSTGRRQTDYYLGVCAALHH